MEPASSVIRRTAHRGRCALRRVGRCQRKTGVVRHPEEGASGTPPPTVVARCRFQRSREVQFTSPVTFHAASPVTLLLVGCTVLGAPWLRDCRAGLDADVRPDRQYPRLIRRTRLRPPPHASYPAGTARAPLVRVSEVVRHPAPGGRGSPPLRRVSGKVSAYNRRCPSSSVGASGTPPLTGGLFTLRCGVQRRGAARAPFFTGAITLPIHPRREGVEARPYGGWGG